MNALPCVRIKELLTQSSKCLHKHISDRRDRYSIEIPGQDTKLSKTWKQLIFCKSVKYYVISWSCQDTLMQICWNPIEDSNAAAYKMKLFNREEL